MNHGYEEDQDPELEIKNMMADMQFAIKLVVADGIAATAASHVDGNTITLFGVHVGKLLGHKDALEKIAETAKTDRSAAAAEFAKLEGVKVDTKDNVTVTIKYAGRGQVAHNNSHHLVGRCPGLPSGQHRGLHQARGARAMRTVFRRSGTRHPLRLLARSDHDQRHWPARSCRSSLFLRQEGE